MEKSSAQAANNDSNNDKNIQLVPKFLAGLKADVKDNVFFLDENNVIYPAGHNIVIYNIEEKN